MIYNLFYTILEKGWGSERLSKDSFQSPKTKLIKHFYHFSGGVKRYSLKGKDQDFPKPAICPICRQISTCLVSHDFYERYACNGWKVYRIVIKVWKCKIYRRYVSTHPDFLIPYRQYTFRVVYRVLQHYIRQGRTMQESLRRVFREEVRPGYQTLQHWIKDIQKTCERWVAILQTEGGFTTAFPEDVNHDRPLELVHFMQVCEKYFNAVSVDDRDRLHGILLHRCRGSPLSGLFLK